MVSVHSLSAWSNCSYSLFEEILIFGDYPYQSCKYYLKGGKKMDLIFTIYLENILLLCNPRLLYLQKKAHKQQKKAHKKALKYGLPIAGAGLGAYALHKGFHHHGHHHHHHGSSSSSSSSSSEEEWESNYPSHHVIYKDSNLTSVIYIWETKQWRVFSSLSVLTPQAGN